LASDDESKGAEEREVIIKGTEQQQKHAQELVSELVRQCVSR